MNTVLITGATSGIGEATAREFAKKGFRVIITGRRADKLNKLQSEIINAYGSEVITLCFDVRERDQVKAHIEKLTSHNMEPDILVNNAGLAAGVAPIDEGLVENWEKMIDTNIKGLLYVSEAVIPMMKKKGRGHIINIGSIAGKEAYKNGNVYCATKHAVDALTKTMRIDLLPFQIKVSSVCPGAVETEFSIVRYEGDINKAKDVYQGYTPLMAQDIAETIWFVVSRPAHVCINDILVMPTAQANTTHINRTI